MIGRLKKHTTQNFKSRHMNLYQQEIDQIHSPLGMVPTTEKKTQLEAFHEAFKTADVVRTGAFANCYVYKTLPGECKMKAMIANGVITDLRMPMIAIPTTFHTRDSFIVQYLYN